MNDLALLSDRYYVLPISGCDRSRVIPTNRIEWIRHRHFDLNGRLFRFEGEIYRGIYPSKTEFVRSLFERGIVDELVEKGLLIDTEISSIRAEGFGLVLRHRKLPFLSKGHEWPRSLLRDAALCSLDLRLALLPHGLGLVDGHSSNLGQIDACRPVWVDFGSLVPYFSVDAVEQYRQFFRRPLELLQRAPSTGGVVRSILRSGGLNEDVAFDLGRGQRSPARVWRAVTRRVDRALARLNSFRDSRAGYVRLLLAERDHLLKLKLANATTPWGSYHSDELEVFPDSYNDYRQSNARAAAIFKVIDDLRPRRVIDVAANGGFHAFYAARRSIEVLAMDYDETAIDSFYRTARDKGTGHSIACACADVLEDPPVERSADLVLALALTHHLAFSQGCTFDGIAASLARYSTKALLVEFMPNGIGGTVPLPNPLPEWHRLDLFCDSLRRHFPRVEIVEYPYDATRNRRTLILARK